MNNKDMALKRIFMKQNNTFIHLEFSFNKITTE